jgi:hypothetical protein
MRDFMKTTIAVVLAVGVALYLAATVSMGF